MPPFPLPVAPAPGGTLFDGRTPPARMSTRAPMLWLAVRAGASLVLGAAAVVLAVLLGLGAPAHSPVGGDPVHPATAERAP